MGAMPTTKDFSVRILEIDTAHSSGRTNINSIIDPIVSLANLQANAAKTGIEVKGGDLQDADFNTHDSYFVGIRYPRTEFGESQAQSLFAQCRNALTEVRSAVITEIPESHPAYARLVSTFGW